MAALAQAAGAANVSPFRSPFRSGRVVGVRYTKFASHKRLVEQHLYGPTLDTAVAIICDELDRHPGELRVTAVDGGALEIACRMRPTVAADLLPGTLQVVATVTGITASEFAVGLLEIQRPNYVMVSR